MATPPVTTPTTSEPVNLNTLTPEQIADQLAAQSAPAAQPTTTEPDRVYEFKTQTGQVFRGKNYTEVINDLIKSVENGTSTIADLNKKVKEFQAPVVAAPAVAEPQFDNNKYYQLLAESPIAANSYMLQFTPEAQELRKQTEELRTFQQGMQTQAQVNQFKAEAPDFPLDDASTQKFEETWNKMGLAITTQNLKLVHGYCLANKIYAPHSDTQAAALTTAQPLPTLSGGTAAATNQGVNVNTMPLEQLEAYIKSLNGQ